MSPTLFRTFIIFAQAAGVAAGSIDALWPTIIPEPLATASKNVSHFSLISDEASVPTFFFGSWAIVSIISTVGLFFFWRWARPAALLTTLVGVPITLLTGADVYSGWSIILLSVSSLAWGSVLTLTYFSSLSKRFVGSNSHNER